MNICRICENASADKPYIAREMMFGYRDEFEYFACSQCGCLQIKEVPADLSRYYSDDYYSFNEQEAEAGFLKRFLKHQRARYGLGKKSLLGMLAARKYGLPNLYEWAKKGRLNFDSKILDVGCGRGFLLLKFKEEGFTNLIGVDPFIAEETSYGEAVKIYKREINSLEQQFDFVMLHHSFEHVAEPLSMLKEVHRVLKPEHYALIRMPVVPCYAWRTYGVNWIQLDAPRHLFLHSIESMSLLAQKAGFEIADITFDSDDLQFWGSELYQKDIALYEYFKSVEESSQKVIFSEEEMRGYREKARELNEKRDGDSACFYLYKA